MHSFDPKPSKLWLIAAVIGVFYMSHRMDQQATEIQLAEATAASGFDAQQAAVVAMSGE